MQTQDIALTNDVETVAELRELYRAAEARAARLRLLSSNGRQLALADATNIEQILQVCADQLGYFLGRRGGAVRGATEAGLPILAPGADGRVLGVLSLDGLPDIDAIADAEDREAVRLNLEMIAATIDRVSHARELQDREARLEYVVGRLFSAQEEERRRVSHELHDGVAQTATALARMLDRPGSAIDHAKLAGIARELVGELRGVIRGLRPTVLDDLGLEAGLRALAEALESEGFAVTVMISSDVTHWPTTIETALYRVAQEALNNVRKHAGGPCAVSLELSALRDAEPPFLCITDMGHGSRAARDPARPNFGIDVMRERMASIGGKLDWLASESGGVTVRATFPRIA